MSVFETETMAELCIKQGLVSEALAIYRRLVDDAPDEATRARRAERLAELQRISRGAVAARGQTPAGPASGAALVVERRGDTLAVTWSLPAGTQSPALQVLVLRRGPTGIETEHRTLPLGALRGSTTLAAANLHSAHAAAGWLDGARFVPLARAALLPDGAP